MTHVLVIGGGGREHALVWKLAQSPRVSRITVAPGNAGTAKLAENVDIDATDIVSLLDFAESHAVDITVVGPEEPLAHGLADQFEAVGIPTFGPRRQAALIETSKAYAKQLMITQGVPTAPYVEFTRLDDALDYLLTHSFENIVIKADGLARGKGVFLPAGESDAEGILRSLLERDSLGVAGRRVLIEKRLHGDELSVMAFTDGHTAVMMPPVRDYKPLYDGNQGRNTGGMGSYAPALVMDSDQLEQVHCQIIEPVLAGLQENDAGFAGVLYAGVVLTEDGPMALELNVRMGDPAAQAVLPLLDGDLLDVIEACVTGTLDQINLRWYDAAAVSIVMATPGYPERTDPNLPVVQTRAIPDDVIVFHAGTAIAPDGTLVTTGGRILNVTAMARDLPHAIARAYEGTHCMHFEGAHYRTDIGSHAMRYLQRKWHNM